MKSYKEILKDTIVKLMSYIEKPFGTSYCVIENDEHLYFHRIPTSVNMYPSYSSRHKQLYYLFNPTRWISDGYRLTGSRLTILENIHAHRVLKQVPWLAVSLWVYLDDPDVVVKIMGLFIEMRK